MKPLWKTLACLTLTGLSALALDKEFVDQMMTAAKGVERDAAIVSVSLKTKRIDAADVRQKIDAMSADLTKLQELVKHFESTHPNLSERDLADWKLIKEKVQLLEIFHDQKKKLAAEDLDRNRAMLRAHAEGVAKRAQKLQESVTRLQRVPLS